MIHRFALTVALVFAATLALTGNHDDSGHGDHNELQTSHQTQTGPGYLANKNRKNNPLPKEFEKAVEPLIVLKNQLEEQLPQKELNSIKQMAFRILLMARRYL